MTHSLALSLTHCLSHSFSLSLSLSLVVSLTRLCFSLSVSRIISLVLSVSLTPRAPQSLLLTHREINSLTHCPLTRLSVTSSLSYSFSLVQSYSFFSRIHSRSTHSFSHKHAFFLSLARSRPSPPSHCFSLTHSLVVFLTRSLTPATRSLCSRTLTYCSPTYLTSCSVSRSLSSSHSLPFLTHNHTFPLTYSSPPLSHTRISLLPLTHTTMSLSHSFSHSHVASSISDSLTLPPFHSLLLSLAAGSCPFSLLLSHTRMLSLTPTQAIVSFISPLTPSLYLTHCL